MDYGPKEPLSEAIHSLKYRAKGETFKEAMSRVADALADNPEHFREFRDALLYQRFLPAGRIQAAVGSPKVVTPFNCFVSGTIEDSMDDIMAKAGQAAETMRLGGGIGYDFSGIRPKGDHIKSLDSTSSGPVSFMKIFDSVCGTISSAGHRRGAQMGVLRVDHPDILEFVKAKANRDQFTNFNFSVGVTDAFMEAVKNKEMFSLVFQGRVYAEVDAVKLWEDILRTTWDWAEPGVLFIDRMNKKNNLWYCETIAATNPCGEQPLPPYGACLLGSLNLVKYIATDERGRYFDVELFRKDICNIVRAMDNVNDVATFPLPEQKEEALSKRRMGIGVTGLANAIEALGHPYASEKFIVCMDGILSTLRDTAYRASISLAIEKGPFPLFDPLMLESDFCQTLPTDIREDIRKYGIRNSHLLSIAPTGTISLSADNVSSGLEPVFEYKADRKIFFPDGQREFRNVTDYGVKYFGVKGKTAGEVSIMGHVKVLTTASYYVDSACSKTTTVNGSTSWEEFKDVYMRAYDGGASGCTTYNVDGKRYPVMKKAEDDPVEDGEAEQLELFGEGTACYLDPNTGIKTCE